MTQKFWNSFTLVLLFSLALSACAPAAASASGQPGSPTSSVAEGSIQINGAGSTFPLPIYTEWTYAYQYVDPSVAINYQGIGSGGGKKAIIDGTVILRVRIRW